MTTDAMPDDQTWYLDIVSARIQTWLSRTPKLRYRRGASTALANATSRDAFKHLLRDDAWLAQAGVKWNKQAGEVSGVVSLVLPEYLDEAQAADLARRVAVTVSKRIHRDIPACPLSAAIGHGSSYLEAYESKERRVLVGDVLLDVPAGPDESPVSLPCQMCGARAVVHPHTHVFKDVFHDLCADCYTRRVNAGFSSSGSLHRLPKSQRELYERMQELPDVQELDFPNDFTDLATRGRRATDDAPTQLALVYADGNRIGDLLHRLIEAQRTSEQAQRLVKADIAAAIDEASKGAIVDAVRGTFIDGELVVRPATDEAGEPLDDWSARPPVVVHVAAGDDIFVSVPAGMGWTFLRLLSDAFTRRVLDGLTARATAKVGPRDGWDGAVREFVDTPFTLSAGLVFHHASEPFADVVERAETRIAVAKTFSAGRASSVSFLDMTADGAEPVGAREWLIAAHPKSPSLADSADRLGHIASLPAAHRNQLLSLLRAIAHVETLDAASRVELDTALARRVATMGHDVLWQVICGGGGARVSATSDDVEHHLTGKHAHAAQQGLRLYLDTARWWPPSQGAPVGPPAETAAATGASRV